MVEWGPDPQEAFRHWADALVRVAAQLEATHDHPRRRSVLLDAVLGLWTPPPNVEGHPEEAMLAAALAQMGHFVRQKCLEAREGLDPQAVALLAQASRAVAAALREERGGLDVF